MNKELTPLEALHSFDHWIQVEFAEQFKIIETELKKTVVLSNQLEHERKIRIRQEKKLKALEIIKENIGLKMSIDEDSGDEDTACLCVPLDNKEICIVGYVKGKEKIDLLKEVLHESKM